MKYSLLVVVAAQIALVLVSSSLPVAANPTSEEYCGKAYDRREGCPPLVRQETKASGKDFCDEECGGPDAPRGTGSR